MSSCAEKNARYRERYPDRAKAAQKAWRAKNPDKVKARNDYYNRKRTKEEHSQYMREWRKRQPDLAKNTDLKKRFGITLGQYQEKLEAQGGVCAACGSKPGKRSLAVDHDHSTGMIRDLLCDSCNTSLGLLVESKARLLALIEYLDKWGAQDE
ncbi:endonuclease VII domain-containing protein [Halomonas sp. EGI 63088]|uniref:Endonuclease VII domain-containing protein n=1 Tax=Halomonas flagellata TaxID=2920385 RepID=A0ABS9RU49_9GAMM|nr:endonuclease VII domain-containing protein [Halomonas flagellata]MCH4563350.1 endonuclease VII domain-containing protein [Halomonas flagellata]